VCLAVGGLWSTVGVAIGNSIAVCLSVFVSIAYGLRKTPVRLVTLLPRLSANFFCSLLMGLSLYFLNNTVGSLFSPKWFALFVFVIGGILIYLGLWLLVPGGRKMLLNYWNYAIDAVFNRKK